MSNISVGKIGEDLASKYLRTHGYQIIARNFKARYGEIDIVAIDHKVVVFVEVKTRIDESFGTPEEAVTPRKLREVIQTAEYFMVAHPELPSAMRIDVIGIRLSEGRQAYFNHLKSVTM